MLHYGSLSVLATCLRADVLIRRNPAPTAWTGYEPVGPGADLDVLDALLEVAVELAVAELLGGIDAGDDRLRRLKQPHGVGRVEHHVGVDEQDRVEPLDHRVGCPDVAGDIDRRRALRPVDADAVLPLEPPQAMVAVELDEPGDRNVDDMPFGPEFRHGRSAGPTGTDS